MAGGKLPGPTGGPGNNTAIDSGTLCRQASLPPAVLGGAVSTRHSIVNKGPVLAGKTKRDPGYNFDGTPAEDMMFADRPRKSASIRTDPVFSKPDATLNAYMQQLMKSLSIGNMETVAMEMQKRFYKGLGGTWKSATLNAEIANHAAFSRYHYAFLRQLRAALKRANYNPARITTIPMGLLHFSSFWDKVSGLGIAVHQVWSVKAELENYSFNHNSGIWVCDLVYTFYDHFGLDWEDIVKHGDDHIPQYYTGDFFKAWYILQHYRSAKPFITEMTRTVFISGKAV